MTWTELYRTYEEAKKNIASLGYTIGPITEFCVHRRYRRCWGKCYRDNSEGTFRIGISDRLLNANPESVKDTVYHEVIHTIYGCFNHGPCFKSVAKKCNDKFGRRISRLTSTQEMMHGKKEGTLLESTRYLIMASHKQ